MPKSRQSSDTKEKKEKIFYEHGKDGLSLALSIAETEEDKALRKTEKNRRVQEHRYGRHDRASGKKNRLEETKAMIAKQRVRAKKEKAKSRKGQLKQEECGRASTSKRAVAETAATTPRKRVSFA
ncbi:hypothetical protein ID866_5061 [Astraeus odoratus]|nr:hypothetical protein ID866_5061 [Astraeus odoratus]